MLLTGALKKYHFSIPLLASYFNFLLLTKIEKLWPQGRFLKTQRGSQPVKYGFITIEQGRECLTKCLLCMKTLSDAVMKPSLSRRHLESNHAEKRTKIKVILSGLGKTQKDSAWTRLDTFAERRCSSKCIT